jgi:hypothetical protein
VVEHFDGHMEIVRWTADTERTAATQLDEEPVDNTIADGLHTTQRNSSF